MSQQRGEIVFYVVIFMLLDILVQIQSFTNPMEFIAFVQVSPVNTV